MITQPLEQTIEASRGLTYAERAALSLLGRLAVEGALDPSLLYTPSADSFQHLVSALADTLMDAMHTLGSPDTMSLETILDYASSFEGIRAAQARTGGAS